MKPRLTLTEGSITIEIYGGYGEIGGNCVVVKDKDRKVVFDNGIRFQALRRYYRGRIQPLGVGELRDLGVIPPLSVFEDADAVYISHFHLDHLGLLGAIPPNVKVYVPSLDILSVIENWYEGVPTWLAELPHKLYTEVREVKPYAEDDLGVTPIPVSHSAFPSYAFLYRGFDRSVFYSGDLRVRGPLGVRVDTLGNMGRVVDQRGVDIALLEGTNIHGVETPVGPEEFRGMLNNVIMSGGLVTISIDPLDFELFTAISELALLSGRKVVVASPRLADTLTRWDLGSWEHMPELAIAVELEKPVSIPVPVSYVSLKEDVLRSPTEYLLIQDPIGFLEMLRQMRIWREKLPANTIAVLTTPEPLEAESRVEEEILAIWLYMMSVQVYRIRLSGHYYPHELKSILQKLNPRRLVPIHTKYPKLMSTIASIQ